MSFTDNLKKSLGFEEGEFGGGYTFDNYGEEEPFFEDYDPIIPEQSF